MHNAHGRFRKIERENERDPQVIALKCKQNLGTHTQPISSI